jgi:hypothetical protein
MERDYSRVLQPAKWGSGVSLQGSKFEPLMSALGHKRTFGDVRRMSIFTPESGHWNSTARCPLCAMSGHGRFLLSAHRLGGFSPGE